METVEEVEPVINLALKYLNPEHENPKLRYAALHCIGQIADEMQPKFQRKYHTTLLPIIVKLSDDKVPRVSAHAFAAMTNFVEAMDKDEIQPYSRELLQKSLLKSQKGISIEKENAVSTIAAISEAMADNFKMYFTEVFGYLLQLLTSHITPEYK